MRKTGTIVFVLLALILPALAQKPTIQIIPFTNAFFPGAVTGCGFDVLATPQPGRPNGEKIIQFANSAAITGPLFLTLTNLSTGAHVDVSVSGPGQFTFSNDSVNNVLLGSFIQLVPPDVAAAAGLPAFQLIHGRLVLTSDAMGNITSIQSFSGKVQDACQLFQ